MLQDVKPLIADHTEVLCLLNGIGHEDVIEKFVPMENLYRQHHVDCWSRRSRQG